LKKKSSLNLPTVSSKRSLAGLLSSDSETGGFSQVSVQRGLGLGLCSLAYTRCLRPLYETALFTVDSETSE